MHIVLISHYFPPEVNAPAQRAIDHARVWVEQGCSVTVVTAAPSHPYGVLYEGYRNQTSEEIFDGVRVLRLQTVLGANSGTLRRAFNYFSFMASVAIHAGRIGPADIVVSTSPQILGGLSGWPVSRRSKAAWVFEVRDIWPESIVAVGAAKPNPLISLLSWVADWAYRTSDRIVSVSPGFDPHFRSRGVPPEKVVVIPNGVHLDQAPLSATFDDVPELSPLKGRFIAAYVGTLGMAHAAHTILDAAELVKADCSIGFAIVGSGAQREFLREQLERRQLSNVVLLDQQPRDRIAQIWNLVDASIVHLKDHEVFRTVIPTKLLEGMAMGKPILLGVRGEALRILDAAQGGLSFDPENAQGLAQAVTALAGDPKAAAEAGDRGKAYVKREFDRRRNALRYLDELRGIASRARDRA